MTAPAIAALRREISKKPEELPAEVSAVLRATVRRWTVEDLELASRRFSELEALRLLYAAELQELDPAGAALSAEAKRLVAGSLGRVLLLWHRLLAARGEQCGSRVS